MKNSPKDSFFFGVRNILNYCVCFLIFLGCVAVFLFGRFDIIQLNKEDFSIYTMNYDINKLSHGEKAMVITYGYNLFSSTAQLLGKNNEQAYVGNGLSCTNCHLESGTKAFAIPLIGVDKRFPQYRGREDKTGTLEERINGCFERSMNGRKLPKDSKEMQAFIAYIKWLGRYVQENELVPGKGLKPFKLPNRKVNLIAGKKVFNQYCITCHGLNGQGNRLEDGRYEFPPLWGKNAYNNGAGMTRVITAAQFIKYNMPNGTTHENPVLSNEEAYDVAGYINQQKRPIKPQLAIDFPNRLKKPVSTPYPPYADNFPLDQHQLGPFQPIIEFYREEHKINKSK